MKHLEVASILARDYVRVSSIHLDMRRTNREYRQLTRGMHPNWLLVMLMQGRPYNL